MKTKHYILNGFIALATFGGVAFGQTTIADVTFGSSNDGLGGFTHTGIDNTSTFLTTNTNNVAYRNQNTGTTDEGFIRQFTTLDGIDRTPDSGLIYTATATFTLQDGYADDNNRIGMVLFTDPTKVLARDTTGQIGIGWNTDDDSRGGSPGSDFPDALSISDGYEFTARPAAPAVTRNQATPFAQDLYQGTQIILSATFRFTGLDIEIDASMTDAGGVTNLGTATVLAADYTDDYFGFVSAYRARNYDGTPDPTGGDRDNPLVMEYESFNISFVPEPSTLILMLTAAGGLLLFARRRHS